MRHLKSGRKLNRTSSHRQAMFRNMAASLFMHEQIKTTLAKAKELRRVAEPLITLGKNATVANRRLAFSRLRRRDAVGKLFDVLGIRYKDRPGGYLRILKSGYRPGDSAPLAIVQLVDRPTVSEGGLEPAETAVTQSAEEAKTAAETGAEKKPKAAAATAETEPAEKKKAAKKTAAKKKAKPKAAAAKTKKTAKKKATKKKR